ncbi:MAG: DUF1836 domain-containing protein [Eubacteriales bacterium]|nr:DUF1836 domain-containing protein [Eubacteriales bacterium]
MGKQKNENFTNEEFVKELMSSRPEAQAEMPDFDIYMDQLLFYVERQVFRDKQEGNKLTSAMVNNYIRQGLVTRSSGKRYNREQISELTVISVLKEVLSLSEMSELKIGMGSFSQDDNYNEFRTELSAALDETIEEFKKSEFEAQDALKFALKSYANIICCRQILGRLNRQED